MIHVATWFPSMRENARPHPTVQLTKAATSDLTGIPVGHSAPCYSDCPPIRLSCS